MQSVQVKNNCIIGGELGDFTCRIICLVVKLEWAFGIKSRDSNLPFEFFLTVEKMFLSLKKYFVEGHPINRCLILDSDGVGWNAIGGEDDMIMYQQAFGFQTALIILNN